MIGYDLFLYQKLKPQEKICLKKIKKKKKKLLQPPCITTIAVVFQNPCTNFHLIFRFKAQQH